MDDKEFSRKVRRLPTLADLQRKYGVERDKSSVKDTLNESALREVPLARKPWPGWAQKLVMRIFKVLRKAKKGGA